MPSAVKALLMWLVLLIAMVGNGVFRVLVLQPRLGEAGARQASCLIGITIILLLTAFFVRTLARTTSAALFGIGLLWLALTVTFEIVFGRYVSRLNWETLLADYDMREGRLWPLVLLTTLLAPWLCGSARSHLGHSARRAVP